jgi:hypothetical protein
MMRLANAGAAVQVALALGLALVAAPVVRTVTAELDNTVGRAWPFSLTRCAAPATPGCRDMAVGSVLRPPTGPIRTGRL